MNASPTRLLLALTVIASPAVSAQTQVWSSPSTTSTWSEPVRTETWSEPARTETWSAPSAPAERKPAQGPARLLAVGDRVEVSSSGGWYAASVLQVGEGRYLIRYDGWGSAWDEWVGPERMRLPDGGAVAAPPVRQAPPAPVAAPKPVPPPAPPVPPPARATPPAADTRAKVWSTHPAGRWVCRTWDYGQVNRVGEFVLNKDGSYRDLFAKGTGRYKFDAKTNRITFLSGPQKVSAPIHFNAAGHGGKGHIVFDYGGGAKLDCYREALP